MMVKIGVIGSDNSHALHFSKLANIRNEATGEYQFPNVRITGIYGENKEQTMKVASEGNIEFIAKKPEELMGKVDAVMVVFRHGDLHMPYALPYVEAGIPVWIDKPFTIKIGDAKRLIAEAYKSGAKLYGGSTLRYNYDILMLKNTVENAGKIGGVMSGAINFPASLDSEYGGLFFYGGHLSEMVMAVFGYEIKSVVSHINNGNILVIAKYDNYNVAMQFLSKTTEHYGIVYGAEKTVVRNIDGSLNYYLGFSEFIKNLESGQTTPEHILLKPVVLLNAVQKSIETGREVFLSEFE